MFSKVLLLSLVALVFSRVQAETPSSDEVATEVRKYLSLLGAPPRDTTEELQFSELSKKLETLLRDKIEEAGTLQKKLEPLASELHSKLSQLDSVQLKEQVLRELGSLQAYSDKFHQQISRSVQDLQEKLGPYASELQSQVSETAPQLARHLEQQLRGNVDKLRVSLTPIADELHTTITQNVDQMKDRMAPLADRLRQDVARLQRDLTPYAYEAQEKLGHQWGTLSSQMKQNADELRVRLSPYAEEMQARLAPYADKMRENLEGNAAELRQSLGKLSGHVDRHVEDFRRNVRPLEETLNQAVVKQVAGLRQTLEPYAGEIEEHLSVLEKGFQDQFDTILNSAKQQTQSQGPPFTEGEE
ncbi:apolipoprotein A-IV [Tachyglossus aculeatus]|uniref:apolipoprotein A-IV n=1 Tax=Tachyglossus aculeatus TaxID=9261 RepID=UPI0018F432CB|nr:apolipoprotein A-IV [Tachyglossus aculeatus]